MSVNHAGSPQDETHLQNSFTPVQNTSHQIASLPNSLLRQNQPFIYLSMHSNTCFGTSKTSFHSILCYLFIFRVGTHYGNLFKSLVDTSTLTCFIPRVPQETNKGEWTRKVKIRTRKNFLAEGKHLLLYSDLLQTLKGRTFVSSGFSTEGKLISASTVPQCWTLKAAHRLTADGHCRSYGNVAVQGGGCAGQPPRRLFCMV